MVKTTILRFAAALAIVLAAGPAGAEEHAEKPAAEEHSADHAAAHGKHYDPSTHFNFLGSPGEHYGKDATGGAYGDGVMIDPKTNQPILDSHGNVVEEPMSAPFIFLVLNFVLFFMLLAWKGGPALSKLAADRHDQIKTALDEAANLRKQAHDKLTEYEAKLKQADAEIGKLVEGMRADAEADKKRILENAERQAAQMKRDAEQRIAAELELASAQLRREVTAAAIAAAEKLLRDKMTSTDQSKVVATFISDVQNTVKARSIP